MTSIKIAHVSFVLMSGLTMQRSGMEPATPSTEKPVCLFLFAALCATTWVLPMELGGS